MRQLNILYETRKSNKMKKLHLMKRIKIKVFSSFKYEKKIIGIHTKELQNTKNYYNFLQPEEVWISIILSCCKRFSSG